MARRQAVPYRHPLESRVRDLENDLFMAREVIINLMSAEHQKILRSYYSIDEKTGWYSWTNRAAEQIIDLIPENDLKHSGSPYSSPRALCPLCGDRSSSVYETGFAVPEGLTRHLLGSHNARQCGVFGAAFALAMEHVNRKFPWTPTASSHRSKSG